MKKQQEKLHAALRKCKLFEDFFSFRVNYRWTQVQTNLALGKQGQYVFVKVNLCTEFQENSEHIVSEAKELCMCYSTLDRTSPVY